LIVTLVNYDHPTYKGYIYPQYIGFVGMMIALVSVIPVPALAVYQLITSRGSTVQVSNLPKMFLEWKNHECLLISCGRFVF